MAFAAYLVFNTDDIDRGAPLRMYLLQLLVNVLCPSSFPAGMAPVLVFLAAPPHRPRHPDHDGIQVYPARRLLPHAALLTVVPFAAYLNLAFYLLNR